eukprot:scaffold2438_cov54-Cylindrotheca_fusiformis.AAC.1
MPLNGAEGWRESVCRKDLKKWENVLSRDATLWQKWTFHQLYPREGIMLLCGIVQYRNEVPRQVVNDENR